MICNVRGLVALVGSFAICVVALIAFGGNGTQHERILVIHSDDAGLCEAVNEGTISALENGVVSSVSIMTVCPGFADFARYAAANPQYDYGVHLVLTSESAHLRWGPLLQDRVPSLVQPDGSFWRTSEEVSQHASPDEVRRELRAQIRLAQKSGISISHLDHHMWVLLQRPEFLRIYIELGYEFNLPIRLHRAHAPSECGASLQDPKVYDELIRPLVNQGAPLFDFIETENYGVPPGRKRDFYLGQLRELKPGISEFVIHCSAPERQGLTVPGMVENRAADTRVFTSQECRDEIKRLGIRICNWRELTKMSL